MVIPVPSCMHSWIQPIRRHEPQQWQQQGRSLSSSNHIPICRCSTTGISKHKRKYNNHFRLRTNHHSWWSKILDHPSWESAGQRHSNHAVHASHDNGVHITNHEIRWPRYVSTTKTVNVSTGHAFSRIKTKQIDIAKLWQAASIAHALNFQTATWQVIKRTTGSTCCFWFNNKYLISW